MPPSKPKTKPDDFPVKTFLSPAAFRAWLAKHHAAAQGVWVRYFNKKSGKKGITYDEALDEALCFGWIDSQSRGYDAESHIQRYTPRRAKSLWSTRNKSHVARLVRAKRMAPAGLSEVARAKKDGRWAAAYAGPSEMAIPPDFLAAVAKHAKAHAFLLTLNKANRYAIAWRLHTAAKPETRAARFAKLLAMLKRGEKLH